MSLLTAALYVLSCLIPPFPFFVFCPALVLQGSLIETIHAFSTAIIGIILLGGGLEGYLVGLGRVKLPTLAWTLALGTDIGGNATPIGASANVVGTAIADKEGYPISWGRFCKYALPAMIIVVALCWLYLLVRYA